MATRIRVNLCSSVVPSEPCDGKIRLGVSACLVGQKTRYDGTDKLDRFLVETLGKYVEFVPVCPEVECGLGVPREAMRLVGDPDSPRLVTIDTEADLTPRMNQWAARRVKELESESARHGPPRPAGGQAGLHGFILKAGSPSCGIRNVSVYPENGGAPILAGIGLFARAIMERFPELPAADEDSLRDANIREKFLKRVCRRSGTTLPPLR